MYFRELSVIVYERWTAQVTRQIFIKTARFYTTFAHLSIDVTLVAVYRIC